MKFKIEFRRDKKFNSNLRQKSFDDFNISLAKISAVGNRFKFDNDYVGS